jgi:tRNA 2-thiouridine synthesizing protein A
VRDQPEEGGPVTPEPDARVSPSRDPVVIDGGDRACVRLLLELRSRIAGLPGGTVIHLIASDPAAPLDLPAWCHLTGHSYLGAVPAARPTYAMRTVPAPAGTDPASPWRRRA